MEQDIFANYFEYVRETEPPIIFHRWSYLTSLGALIGQKAWIDQGHAGRVFPTLFVQLLGEPAARKSTSIKIIKRLITLAGYDTFAADKTTKEQFLQDLEGVAEDLETGSSKGKPRYDTVTANNLWGREENDREPREVFIMADEFTDFAGAGNTEFFTTLGQFWDFDSPESSFTQRFKNTRSLNIYQPTVSILSGNTPERFNLCFPPIALGGGFLTRLLLIYGERSGRKITRPPLPPKEIGASLVSFLQAVRSRTPGELDTTPAAYLLLDAIYKEETILPDIRFRGYINRRGTQLLKISVILAVCKFHRAIEEDDILQANTILTHAELLMPKAMGEFGKSKDSDVVNKVMEILNSTHKPLTGLQLWGLLNGPSLMSAQKNLADLLNGLLAANKIQLVNIPGVGSGFLPKKAIIPEPKYVDWNFLTEEERSSL